MIAAGIDIGGTKIEAQVFDAEWRQVARHRATTLGQNPDFLDAIAEMANWVEGRAGRIPIGLGSAGLVNSETGMALTANLPATGHRLVADVAAKVGRGLPFINDCRALTLSEAVFGAGRGADPVVGLILGTGVGGGVAVNGQLLPGPRDLGGEFGHVPAPAHIVVRENLPLVTCGCGRAGCVETLISGPGLGRIAVAKTGTRLTPEVIRASLSRAAALYRPIVIEATSNQVNQDGGYSGQRPADFIAIVQAMAAEIGLDPAQLAFGGDHLGPQGWRGLDAGAAMAKADWLVRDYVAAGFTKIHLDCSQGCKGEDPVQGDEVTAARSALLARACVEAADGRADLIFVIGTEVPPPGGARAGEAGDIPATDPARARATLEAHRTAFAAQGVDFDAVAGLVLQPGVEFSPMHVHHFPTNRALPYRVVLADRIRYYWPLPEAQAALAELRDWTGGAALPDSLLLQVFSRSLLDRAEALTGAMPDRHLQASVHAALDPYFVTDRAQQEAAA